MRSREEIEKDIDETEKQGLDMAEFFALELLLDIRDLLIEQKRKRK